MMRPKAKYRAEIAKRHTPKPFGEKYKDLLIPLVSLLVALISTMSGTWATWQNSNVQIRLKELDVKMKDYELNFKIKQEGYVNFYIATEKSSQIVETLFEQYNNYHYNAGARPNEKLRADLLEALRDIDSTLLRIEPFLMPEDRAEMVKLVENYKDEVNHLISVILKDTDNQDYRFGFLHGGDDGDYWKSYRDLINSTRKILYDSLFGENRLDRLRKPEQ